jgi:hypothetical protein
VGYIEESSSIPVGCKEEKFDFDLDSSPGPPELSGGFEANGRFNASCRPARRVRSISPIHTYEIQSYDWLARLLKVLERILQFHGMQSRFSWAEPLPGSSDTNSSIPTKLFRGETQFGQLLPVELRNNRQQFTCLINAAVTGKVEFRSANWHALLHEKCKNGAILSGKRASCRNGEASARFAAVFAVPRFSTTASGPGAQQRCARGEDCRAARLSTLPRRIGWAHRPFE